MHDTLPLTDQIAGPLDAEHRQRWELLQRQHQPADFAALCYLAAHAAGAAVFTADMLYKLAANFADDEVGQTAKLTDLAVSDLLQSPICKQVAPRVYTLYSPIRHALRQWLRANPRLGEARRHKLASFVWAYLQDCPDELTQSDLRETLRWEAQTVLDPNRAGRELLDRVSKGLREAKLDAELQRQVDIVAQNLPAKAGGKLSQLAFAVQLYRGSQAYQRGNLGEALRFFEQLAPQLLRPAGQEGVKIPVPEEILVRLKKKLPAPPPEPTTAKYAYAFALYLLLGQGVEASEVATQLGVTLQGADTALPYGELFTRYTVEGEMSPVKFNVFFVDYLRVNNALDNLLFSAEGLYLLVLGPPAYANPTVAVTDWRAMQNRVQQATGHRPLNAWLTPGQGWEQALPTLDKAQATLTTPSGGTVSVAQVYVTDAGERPLENKTETYAHLQVEGIAVEDMLRRLIPTEAVSIQRLTFNQLTQPEWDAWQAMIPNLPDDNDGWPLRSWSFLAQQYARQGNNLPLEANVLKKLIAAGEVVWNDFSHSTSDSLAVGKAAFWSRVLAGLDRLSQTEGNGIYAMEECFKAMQVTATHFGNPFAAEEVKTQVAALYGQEGQTRRLALFYLLERARVWYRRRGDDQVVVPHLLPARPPRLDVDLNTVSYERTDLAFTAYLPWLFCQTLARVGVAEELEQLTLKSYTQLGAVLESHGDLIKVIDQRNGHWIVEQIHMVPGYAPASYQPLYDLLDETLATQPGVQYHRTSRRIPAYCTPHLVHIQGGTFEMGDTFGEGGYDEKPVHQVTLRDFWLGRYAVTFEEYDAYCAATGSKVPGDQGWGRGRQPVINVSWQDAVLYCNWLSEQQGLKPVYTLRGEEVSANWAANGYRLPTEGEWEYAAREGGRRVRFGNGKDVAYPSEINFDASEENKLPYSGAGEYREKTVEVGSLNCPNALGLHDMSGNVWEWCWDWYGGYPTEPQDNPTGPVKGSSRVRRGGSWLSAPRLCRAAYRSNWNPLLRNSLLGFRLARS